MEHARAMHGLESTQITVCAENQIISQPVANALPLYMLHMARIEAPQCDAASVWGPKRHMVCCCVLV